MATGMQGASKVDCVTVWLLGANWNCTMSPTAALMLLGKKARVPLAAPTWTTWTVTDAARAELKLIAERAKVVNCMLTMCIEM